MTYVDISYAETVEEGLDALIEKRARQRRRDKGERVAHELWQQSVDRYHARCRRNGALWFVSESYEARAEALCEEYPGEGMR